MLTAPYVLEYAYKRSLGTVLSAFVTGLRDKQILGIRTADGRVIVPPQEYDPATAEALSEMVPVADTGVLTTWAWVTEPREEHPLDAPFAFAMIQLEGADSAMLHCVRADSIKGIKTGMRVRAVWRDEDERGNGIRDIVCFEAA